MYLNNKRKVKPACQISKPLPLLAPVMHEASLHARVSTSPTFPIGCSHVLSHSTAHISRQTSSIYIQLAHHCEQPLDFDLVQAKAPPLFLQCPLNPSSKLLQVTSGLLCTSTLKLTFCPQESASLSLPASNPKCSSPTNVLFSRGSTSRSCWVV